MLDIFKYQDYRTYLKEYYEEQKRQKSYFSYRYFSKLAGINSSAFLPYIIKGERNLTKKSILKISTAIGHTKEEADYFENLVFFNQAKKIAEKSHYYSKLIDKREPLDITTITSDKYEFYRNWYHSVLREVISYTPTTQDYTRLGALLLPPISREEVKKSITLLEKLGFIRKKDDGTFEQSESLIMSAPKGQDSFVIEQFQVEMLKRAISSYDTISRKERMSASTTFCISKETFELFKKKTREFRKELLEIAQLDSNPEMVYQYTFNLFPLVKDSHNREGSHEE